MKKVYVKGYVGNLGTKVLIKEKHDELSKFFSKAFLDSEISKLECNEMNEDGTDPSLSIFGKNIIDLEEIYKGGVLAALWKICDRNKWGLRYSLRDIPIMQSTVEIANYFDLNPYRLLTENAIIYVVEDEHMGKLCESYTKAGCTIPLTLIGEITNEKKRVRTDGEAEAFLTKDFKDEIDKVILKYTKSIDGK